MIKYFLALLTIFQNVAIAQNTIGLPQIINYSSNIHKGGTQTWDIQQDKLGRMYFANNDGLLTFDGTYWKKYVQPNATILRSIAIANNRIYAGGQDEIGYYSPDVNGILKYTSLKNLIPENERKFADLWDIEVFNGAIFFRSWDKIFEFKNDVIQVHKAKTGWIFMKKAGNQLFAQDKKNGFYEFKNNLWTPIGKIENFNKIEITGVVTLNKDSLLISTLLNGLFVFANGVLTKKNIANSIIKDQNSIYTISSLTNNEIAIGTTSNGCIILDHNYEVIQQFSKDEGVLNNNVLSIFVDSDNNLWCGLDNGISYIAYNSSIKYIKPNKNNELAGYSAKVLNNNQLFIATANGTYCTILNPQQKDISFSKSNFTLIKNTEGQNWRLDIINNQLLLAHNNGSFVITQHGSKPLTTNNGTWLFLPNSTILPTNEVLVGNYTGISFLNYVNENFLNYTKIEGIEESLRFLAIDNNIIWASHPYRGVYRIQLDVNKKIIDQHLFTEKDGLPSTSRNFVFKIKNKILITTEKGIYEFNDKTKLFFQSAIDFSTSVGKIPIQYLYEDVNENIWFCNNKKIGVYRNSNSKNKVIFFPELTGEILAGFENIYSLNNNNIFIASNKGIIHINPDNYFKTTNRLNVLLSLTRTSEKTDSTTFEGYFYSNNEKGNEQNNNSVTHFPIKNNLFHFEFSSPSFYLQNNIEYSYLLEGYDKNWSAKSTITIKEFTNLPSGKYTFKVKAFDNLGNESAITSYTFIVDPAWYRTTLAYLFYIFIIGLILYWLYKWQKLKFVLQRKKFEEEEKRLKYIHQLEVEKNEKEIIQLQNENLINEVIYKNKELADASMHLVERSDALTKIKDELQQLYKKTGGNHDVKKAIQLVSNIETNNNNWDQFALHFDEVNNDFLKKLSTNFPNLTNTDLKVCAYLQLKLSSKEIAQLMNISVRGVELSRYRLRKKLQLKSGQTLTDFLNKLI